PLSLPPSLSLSLPISLSLPLSLSLSLSVSHSRGILEVPSLPRPEQVAVSSSLMCVFFVGVCVCVLMGVRGNSVCVCVCVCVCEGAVRGRSSPTGGSGNQRRCLT